MEVYIEIPQRKSLNENTYISFLGVHVGVQEDINREYDSWQGYELKEEWNVKVETNSNGKRRGIDKLAFPYKLNWKSYRVIVCEKSMSVRQNVS